MKKRVVLTLSVMLAVVCLSAVADHHEGSWTGEVVDLACYVAQGAKGADHAGCAKSCVKNGQPLRGSARLTHALPDAPVILSPEEEEEDVDPNDTVVEWERVPDPPGSRISGYIVVVEKDEGQLETFTVNLPRGATSVSVPPEFMRPGTAYKAEVLAVERSGNKTITETEFETGGGGGGDDDEEDD